MARGRPRKFDEDAALTAAMVTFWEKGLAATSLDDLAGAMGMNRPSIYAAFGNKEAIYRRSLARFCGQLDQAVATTLEGAPALRPGLVAFFDQAIEVYCSGEPAMGCLMICTAPVEALSHPQVGDDLTALIHRLDDAFARRLRRAIREGEVDVDLPVRPTAQLLQGTLHTIALRARSGAPRTSLRKMGRHAAATLVGPAPAS